MPGEISRTYDGPTDEPENAVQVWERHRKTCPACKKADEALGVTALGKERMRCEKGKDLAAAAIASLFPKNPPAEKPAPALCLHCKNTRTVEQLGGGGDYETWPCPNCRPEEYRKALADQYSPGYGDGSAD